MEILHVPTASDQVDSSSAASQDQRLIYLVLFSPDWTPWIRLTIGSTIVGCSTAIASTGAPQSLWATGAGALAVVVTGKIARAVQIRRDKKGYSRDAQATVNT